MSQANSNDNGGIRAYRKPRANLYTAMLVIALVALILGCVCLYLEMDAYQFKINGGPVVYHDRPAAMAAVAAAPATAPASWLSGA